MAKRKLIVEVISPEKVLYAKEADAVTATTPLGEIGILPLHIPLVSTLVAGEVRIKQGNEVDYFFVGGGFLEVKEDRVSILASEARPAQEIDPEAERKAQEELKKIIEQNRKEGREVDDLLEELRRSAARLRVSRRARGG